MRTETKNNIRLGFASLLKNDAAIEAAKTVPGYVPVIIGLIAAFIPVIPLMVSTSNSYGSSFLKNSTYNLDRYNTATMMSVYDEGYDFQLFNGKLLRYKDGNHVSIDLIEEMTPIGEYTVDNADGGKTIKYQLFYSERVNSGTTDEQIKTLLNTISSTKYLEGTTYIKDSDEALNKINERQAALTDGSTYSPVYYRPSYTVIYREGLYTSVNNEYSNKEAATYAGDWNHSSIEGGLLKTVLDADKYGASLLEKDANGDYKLLRDGEFTASIQKNMNKVYDNAYLTAKQKSFLLYTLVFYGVYVVLIAFMGLMMFLLTRGKRNPMNYMSFWLCTKISAWSTITPAVLALVLGFLITNFATMFFIILFGVRIMWMSMRQLRPAY